MKTVKISEKVHVKVKVHVAKTKQKVTPFVEQAINDRIYTEKVINSNNKRSHTIE